MVIQFFNEDGSSAGANVTIGPKVTAAILASGASSLQAYLVQAVSDVVRLTVNQYAPEVLAARQAKQAGDVAAAAAYAKALDDSEKAVDAAITALMTPGA